MLVRLRRRLLETSFKGLDSIKEGDVIALISDVSTSGGGLAQAAEKIKAKGAKVPVALVLVNRWQKVIEKLESMGIELIFAEEILNTKDLMKKEPINKFIKRAIKDVENLSA